MNVNPQLKYEAVGIAVLVVAGIAAIIGTALLSLLFPWVSVAWVFIVLVAAALGWLRVSDHVDEDSAVIDHSTNEGVLDVDLVNWANDRVGTRCLRCETEIEYTPLGTSGGQSEHRIECGCTTIRSAPKE